MKKNMIVISLIFLTTICFADVIYTVNSNSRTISKIDLESDEVTNSFAEIGLYANTIAADEDYLYITNSGDNSIQKIDKETGETEADIFIENSSNPYDLVVHDGFVYVTTLFTNKVFKVDSSAEEVVGYVEVGTTPEDIIAFNNKLYTANCAVVYPDYGESSISVIDIENFEVETTIPSETNTQELVVYNNKIYATSTGDFGEIGGKAVVIDPETNEIDSTVELGGTPGKTAVTEDGRVFVGDSMGSGYYIYDAESLEIINGLGNLFASGGAAAATTSEKIILADALDWVSNSEISIYDYEQNLTASYEVGVGVTDLIIEETESSAQDEEQAAKISFSNAYPNPYNAVNSRSSLTIELKNIERGENYHVELFNLKGRKINALEFNGNKALWNGKDSENKACASGIYFYQIKTETRIIETKPISLIK